MIQKRNDRKRIRIIDEAIPYIEWEEIEISVKDAKYREIAIE